MDASDIPAIIFISILGAIFLVVIAALLFASRLDRKGIKNSKKIDAGTPGDHGVYLS